VTGDLWGGWPQEPDQGAVPDRLQDARLGTWPVAPGWVPSLQAFCASPGGEGLMQRLATRLSSGAVVYPPSPFRALCLTDLTHVRVVVLGQDPYHGPGQAHGLAFSVPPGQRIPPSLRNIFKELARSEGGAVPDSGCLEAWAQQGVLLLNTVLTVEQGHAASHARFGWELLTDALIHACNVDLRPKVFMLWGGHAQAKAGLIDASRHLVLQANHPSPLSALRPPVPFIGCGHFAQANAWLASKNEKTIAWL
jgi:uracil-DNA glycosylase